PPAIPLAVRCQVRTRIPSEFGGECHVHLYSNTWDNEEHLALVFGDDIASRSLEEAWAGDTERERMLRGSDSSGNADADDADADADAAPLVRIHSCCFTGETLRSLRCDCAEQLEEAMRCMAKANRGVVLYLKQEGRGIGLRDKLRAYNLIDLGHDTMAANLLLGHPPDARSYEIASAMLRDLGIARVRLLTNNPDKMRHLERDGVLVTERVPMVPASWRQAHHHHQHHHGHPLAVRHLGRHPRHHRDEYLVTKVQRMGHILDIPQQL
ncbi:GTP cyclohydrolase II-domain-containing protein, partial [Geranomyces variabilis]